MCPATTRPKVIVIEFVFIWCTALEKHYDFQSETDKKMWKRKRLKITAGIKKATFIFPDFLHYILKASMP